MKRPPAGLILSLCLTTLTCTAPPYIPVGTYVAPETRRLVTVVWADTVRPIMQATMDSTQPGARELARCLYGGMRRTPTHEVLAVDEMIGGTITEQSDSTVSFECATMYHQRALVGDLHTHPQIASLDQACVPSRTDFISMLDDPRLLVFYILCANGIGYSEFRDGRWTWFMWRSPTGDTR